ncbi:hypothetical protein CEXT_436151 [Caerostris extrusa]|uniref:Uncharacterized protein n=1 Tax=Caerostris extrusa TaxID=172846 RepID=A0AAV4MQ96_CAEEX|nr:hypothetical protein CEXT_436151 [Caerostris extrusa]
MKLEEYSEHEFLMRLSTVNREEPHSPSIYILTTRLPRQARCLNSRPGRLLLQERERDKQSPGVQLIIRPDGVNTRGGRHQKGIFLLQPWAAPEPLMLRDRFCCDCVGVNRSDDSQNGSPKR